MTDQKQNTLLDLAQEKLADSLRLDKDSFLVTIERYGDLLGLGADFCTDISIFAGGFDFHFSDHGALQRLSDDAGDEEARAMLAVYDALVARFMDRAGITSLKKRKRYNGARANLYVGDRPTSCEVLFVWEMRCEKVRQFKVTETRTISMCGAPDASRYDKVEEIITE